MFVPQLLQTVEAQEPSILRDDSPLDKEGFRLYKIRIRENVSKKWKQKRASPVWPL